MEALNEVGMLNGAIERNPLNLEKRISHSEALSCAMGLTFIWILHVPHLIQPCLIYYIKRLGIFKSQQCSAKLMLFLLYQSFPNLGITYLQKNAQN